MGIIREPREIDIMIKSEPWIDKELADFRNLMKEQKAKRKKALSKKEKKHFA